MAICIIVSQGTPCSSLWLTTVTLGGGGGGGHNSHLGQHNCTGSYEINMTELEENRECRTCYGFMNSKSVVNGKVHPCF